jgi:protein involved in polysaccharide export with SLBB domain
MQTSSIRTSTIALCALAGLTTACEQNNLIGQPDTRPDSDPATSNASAREEISARDRAASALATTQLATQSNRPETLQPESTRIKTSLGSIPTLNTRRYLPLPQTRSILPRLSLAPTLVPRSTWQPPVSLGIATPRLTTSTASQPSMATVPGQPGAATAPGLSGSIPTANASLASSQPVGSQPVGSQPVESQPVGSQPVGSQPVESQPVTPSIASDMQGHWSQPIVTALRNADIIQSSSDGSFRPDMPITQDEFVAMVQRAFPDEAISPDSINLRPGLTRAEAAKILYQALADQGRMAPLATLVATQSQPFSGNDSAEGIGQTAIANPLPQPNSAAVATSTVPLPQSAIGETSNVPTKADGDSETSLLSEIAQPMLQAAVLGAEALQPISSASNPDSSESASSSGVGVAVMGEVSRPGGYSLTGADSKPTLIRAIQMAGGVTSTANIRQILVRRAGETLTFDLWQVLQTGSLDKDLVLQSGDTIAIPKATNLPLATQDNQTTPEAVDRIQVGVVGEVNNPGLLELPSNASANQAVMASGGFNRQARKADLIRLNANGTIVRQAIAVDIAKGMNALTNPRLQNNDVIMVQRSDDMAIVDQSMTLSALMKILPIATTLQ